MEESQADGWPWNEGHFPERFAEEDRVATEVAPKLSLTTLTSQVSAVLPTNVPNEAAGVLGAMCLSSPGSTTIPSARRESGGEGARQA